MVKNKLINRFGKVLASIVVGASTLINPISTIPVNAASTDDAMKAKADTLIGNTKIDCWVGSARVLEAGGLLYFADDYESFPMATSNYASGNSAVKLADGSTLNLKVGDVLAFYSSASAENPAHTITFVGADPAPTEKQFLNANTGGTTAYTDSSYSGTIARAEVRRYSVTNSVNVPVTYSETGATDNLELTSPTNNYIVVTNHADGGKVSATVDSIKKGLPGTEYTDANFNEAELPAGSYAEISILAQTAYYNSDTVNYITTTEPSEMKFRAPIQVTSKVYHGKRSESAFADTLAGEIAYLLTTLPDAVKEQCGSANYVNENIRVTDISIKYYTVAGDDNSSDYQREVNFYVDSETTPSKTENYDVNAKVTYKPSVTSTQVFDGWYTDDAYTTLFDGVVTKSATDEPLNLYGQIVTDDGKKATLTVTVQDNTDSANPVPLAGVPVTVVDSAGTTIGGGTTDANGKVTVTNLSRGNYTVSEQNMPTCDETGYTYGANLKSDTVAFTTGNDTNLTLTFNHAKQKVITVHFDDNGATVVPLGGYKDQQTSVGGYVTKPSNPAKYGHDFTGWYLGNASEPYDFDKAITSTSDITLVAHYTKIPTKDVKVSFVDVNDQDKQDLSDNDFTVNVMQGLTAILADSDGKTLSQILESLYALGYEKADVNEKYPATAEYTMDETGAYIAPEDVVVKVVHGTTLDQDAPAETKEVIRTIKFVDEDGAELKTAVTQVGQLQKTAATSAKDSVTGKSVKTPAVTTIKLGWGTYTAPEIAGYTPTVGTLEAVDSTNTDPADFKSETVEIVYIKNAEVTPVTVTITGNKETFTYDGTEHTVTGYTFESSDSSYTDADFHSSVDRSIVSTDAGNFALGLKSDDFVNDNSEYDVSFVVVDGGLVIEPKAVIVTVADATKVFKEADPEFTATVSGTLGSDTVSYTLYRAKGESRGTYKIFASGAKTQGNYSVTYVYGIFTITGDVEAEPEPTPTPEIPAPEPKEEGYVGWHTNIDDAEQTITFPGIQTTASDTTDDATDTDKEEYYYITDKVEYIGLQPNKRYTMTGTLMDKATGNAIEGVEPVSKTFTPQTADGTMSMTFKVKRETLKGKTVVVFETCYFGEEEIAIHADIDDEAQTVTFDDGTMKTTAVDTNTGGKEILIDEDADVKTVYLTDTVTYTNLKPNKNYVLTGTIHVNVDGEDAGELIVNGSPVTATATFAPSEPNGTVDVVFEFDGSDLKDGDKLVVFEDLQQGGTTILTHADITDEDQTIIIHTYQNVIEIQTTATGETGTHEVEVSKTATITDTVTYRGVEIGETYEMKGELHLVNNDGTDGGVIAKGSGKFTAEMKNGTTTIKFTNVDVSDLEDRTLVVFEELYYGDTKVAEHADLTDAGQTVTVKGKVPTIGTTATGDNNGKTVKPEKSVTITDTVSYNNLIVGVDYVLDGTLHLVASDGSDDGVIAVVKQPFTPSTTSGTVKVTFTVDASELEGRSLVVFEDLYRGDNIVAFHADITDKGQTVTVTKTPETPPTPSKNETPSISTTATNENDGKTLAVGESVKVIDTVTYKNLEVGKEYTLNGTLHLVGTDGKDEKTLESESVKFTPTSKDGTVKMTFTVNTRGLEGRSLVVFEDLLLGTAKVADHADITDKGQTVTVETPSVPELHIRTMAYNLADGYDTVYPNKSVTINDIVYFDGLTPGVEYVLEGALHVKNPDGTDGGILYSNGTPVVASKRFTPTVASGATELSFTFDASDMNGTVCVAFEQLYLGEGHVFLTSHEDITDDDQTMWIDRNPKRRRKRVMWIRTGTGKNTMVFGGIGVAAVIALAAVLIKRKTTKAE
ncbi:MAG: VaFE repeat-containing surface-anchored protein [Solobacterium sp.]|nr:VaFE repeat-containing surface-anchored protein [Solobacterium sp.]